MEGSEGWIPGRGNSSCKGRWVEGKGGWVWLEHRAPRERLWVMRMESRPRFRGVWRVPGRNGGSFVFAIRDCLSSLGLWKQSTTNLVT